MLAQPVHNPAGAPFRGRIDMYSQSDIEDAVAGGALTAQQAESLRNHVAARTGVPTADEEHVRWFLGFNDLYIYISAILLLIGLAWLGAKAQEGENMPIFAPLLVAIAAWGLSEFFGRKRRLALAPITFAYVFVWAVFVAVMFLAAKIVGPGASHTATMLVTAVCALCAAGAAFLHWMRFAEPIDVALGTGAVAIAIMSLLGAVLGMGGDPEGTISYVTLLVLGLATLAYAIMWEAKDRRRETARADIAFWLQFVAAWEVIFAVLGLLGMGRGHLSQGAAIAAIAVFLVLALVGLALGRRIWPLLGAIPLGMGIYTLLHGDPYRGMDEYGRFSSGYGDSYRGGMGGGYGGSPFSPYGTGNTGDDVMLTLLIVGIVLILLGMFWTQIRGVVVAILPGPLHNKVPATSQQAAAEAQTFD
jgi:hypothetical protein